MPLDVELDFEQCESRAGPDRELEAIFTYCVSESVGSSRLSQEAAWNLRAIQSKGYRLTGVRWREVSNNDEYGGGITHETRTTTQQTVQCHQNRFTQPSHTKNFTCPLTSLVLLYCIPMRSSALVQTMHTHHTLTRLSNRHEQHDGLEIRFP